MKKFAIIENITPLLNTTLAEIKEKDILKSRTDINRAIAFFTQEIVNCSKAGRIVVNPDRFAELIMYSLNQGNYNLFYPIIELLQWHMIEQSTHPEFLWSMMVLIEHINDLNLFSKVLDMKIVNAALKEINKQETSTKPTSKTSTTKTKKPKKTKK